MRFELIAVGTRQPAWVNQAFEDYSKRLRGDVSLALRELPLSHRGKNYNRQQLKHEESKKLWAAIGKNHLVVALDEKGKSLKTAELADKFGEWKGSGQNVAFLIGGPDGISGEYLEKAHLRWSLSNLTLPHGLARVMVAEALYRAWSLHHNHPYHRS